MFVKPKMLATSVLALSLATTTAWAEDIKMGAIAVLEGAFAVLGEIGRAACRERG